MTVLDDRAGAVYQQAVRQDFAFLKATNQYDDLLARGIRLADGAGFLVPMCALHLEDTALIRLLGTWREENVFAFPSRFPVTLEGTAAWLRDKVLAVEDRLLFLVLDPYGRPVGHLGYANALNDARTMEIDNVVRGVKEGNPGIMAAAMQALLRWAQQCFGPSSIYLRVLQENTHAIRFYEKLGFTREELIPLRWQPAGAGSVLAPLADGETALPDTCFLRMSCQPPAWEADRVILTAGPLITAREASYTLDAARYGWNHEWSKYLTRFERAFADYLGVKYALATSSCTGALHLSLLALGIGPGDEVIVPDMTWVATANAILYTGATPVFADIDPDSWCLDPASCEAKITARTKAILPVHLYGHPAPMPELRALADRYHLAVVEDAAPAIGAECHGQKAGTFGDIAAFSFQGAKLVVTGEGGMIVTNDDALYRRLYTLWDQGRTPGTFWINEQGWKYKMANALAAIGLGQLERVDALIEAKRRIFSWYVEGLAGVPHLTLNREMPWARSIYWMTSLRLAPDAPLGRDTLREALKARQIDTRPVFPAISQYPFWPVKQDAQPEAHRLGETALNLPSGVCLTRAQVDYICASIREVLEAAR